MTEEEIGWVGRLVFQTSLEPARGARARTLPGCTTADAFRAEAKCSTARSEGRRDAVTRQSVSSSCCKHDANLRLGFPSHSTYFPVAAGQ